MIPWFTSDHHFSHENIIKYSSRPFASAKEMDEALVENWNAVVKPEDHIYHLGDVTMIRGGRIQQEWFCNLIHSLNGHKRVFLGNHDHFPIEVYLRAGFEKVYATWRSYDKLIFSHIPIHPESMSSASGNVHGHIHTNPSPKPVLQLDKDKKVLVKPYVNVCVEVTGYRPINLDE